MCQIDRTCSRIVIIFSELHYGNKQLLYFGVSRMNNFHAVVTITLRKGILDVQGKTVEHALHSSSFSSLSNVRIGKHVEMTVAADSEESALTQIDAACKALIANPIIEDYHITLQKAEVA